MLNKFSAKALIQRSNLVRRSLLPAMLATLYLVLWIGPGTPLGRTMIVAHLGLFILWQPFVHAERRLSLVTLFALTGIVLIGTIYMKGWMLLLWIMMLAGLVGGKVLLFVARTLRMFYLLALGFLVVAMLLMAAPLAVPLAVPPPTVLSLAYLALPALLVMMILLPQGDETEQRREVVDFVYSLLVFLMLAVLLLGSLAAMQIFGSAYAEALLQSILLLGVTLLLLGLAWNPSSGFAGIGGLFSRYLMSIGLPIEQWLQALTNLAAREDDPDAFLEEACGEFTRRLPWVRGGEWITGTSRGSFGVTAGSRWEFSHGGMVLVLYTLTTLSPTLIWHCNLLAQLLAQFHGDKQRALALKHMSYMRAIHETGARLTHDVKNLLQSLNMLCSAGLEPGAESSQEYQSLLRRQLPAITGRLAETLEKLNAPNGASAELRDAASAWWQELRQRMSALSWIEFRTPGTIVGFLPVEVFSGVADNLIRNAAEKHLREPALRMHIELVSGAAGFELVVCDTGSAMPGEIVTKLFAGPVSSESGFGIGLYHAARYARAAGYFLELAENRMGHVCFRLAPDGALSTTLAAKENL
ncbi:MAG: sensor histidine kinase [Sulfuritalea sp.]|nr:sensor histidine kinase [Sulfuritalea sp.]